jgi:hypothetical protein
LIWVNFELYKLNLNVEFVIIAEIMKTKNKYMTAMFAAFQTRLERYLFYARPGRLSISCGDSRVMTFLLDDSFIILHINLVTCCGSQI